MGDKSEIAWTDATWNPVVGCSIVSPGCTNCYAMKWAALKLDGHVKHYAGTTKIVKGKAVWTGKVAKAPDHIFTAPMRWKKPRMVFVNSMGDVFHEDVPDEWIDRLFAIMALSPQHTFQILTKRSKRMREYMNEKWQPAPANTYEFGKEKIELSGESGPTGRRLRVEEACEPLLDEFGLADTEKAHLWTENESCKAMQWDWPLKNVWLGVSCEDQARADERIPDLLATPAAVRFVSAEPLLGPIDFKSSLRPTCDRCPPWETPCVVECEHVSRLDWIIAGGESGDGFRPMQIEWAESIKKQCQDAGTKFFFKQDSSRRPGAKGRASDALWACKEFPLEERKHNAPGMRQ